MPSPPHAESGPPTRRFGPNYQEELEIGDGVSVRIRCIRPEDKDELQRGLARVSEEARYLRFFTAKPRLTEAELQYFTEVDGENHFALVALCLQDGEEAEGVAVGRFVRLLEEPHVAEPAIVVTDDMQGKGLGRALMSRLITAAAERDVRFFRSEFLSLNRPITELLSSLAPSISFVADGPTVTAEFPIVAASETENETTTPSATAVEAAREAMEALLRLVAEQTVELRRRFTMIFDPERLRDFLRRLRNDHEE